MRPSAVPVILVRAVIDQDIARSSTYTRASKDIIELNQPYRAAPLPLRRFPV
jgi:hypothetical protein